MYDPKITEQMQQWLATPAEDRDVPAGAMLLLKINRNQILYRNILARPQRMLPKLEYELQKYLRIRLADQTMQGIATMEKELVPKVQKLVIFTDAKEDTSHPWGKRADHDALPDEIRELYDGVGQRYKDLRKLYFDLKQMDHLEPCDRFETLQQLDELDRRIRRDWEQYDKFDPNAPAEEEEDDEENDAPPTAAQVAAARKYISDNRDKLAEMDANSAEANTLRHKVQKKVNTVLKGGGGFSPDNQEKLSQLGITFNV